MAEKNKQERGYKIINIIAVSVFILGAWGAFRHLTSFRYQIEGNAFRVQTDLEAQGPMVKQMGKESVKISSTNYYMVFGSGNFYGTALAFDTAKEAQRAATDKQVFRQYAENGQASMKYKIINDKLAVRQQNGGYLTLNKQKATVKNGFKVQSRLTGQGAAVSYLYRQKYVRIN